MIDFIVVALIVLLIAIVNLMCLNAKRFKQSNEISDRLETLSHQTDCVLADLSHYYNTKLTVLDDLLEHLQLEYNAAQTHTKSAHFTKLRSR